MNGLLRTTWGKVLAAAWMLGVAGAHYWLWVRALVESVPAR